MVSRLVGTVALLVLALGALLGGGWLPGGPQLAHALCEPHCDWLGRGAGGNVNALAEYDGEPYAEGWLSTAAGQSELRAAQSANEPSSRLNAMLAVTRPHDHEGDIPRGDQDKQTHLCTVKGRG
jgi:hypothetical protein